MRSGEGIRAIAIVTKVSIQPIWQIPLISAITLIDNFRCWPLNGGAGAFRATHAGSIGAVALFPAEATTHL